MMRVLIFRLLLALVFTLSVAAPLHAQEPPSITDELGRWIHGSGEPWWLPDSMTKQDVQTLNEKWLEIERDNQATTGNEWTGHYSEGSDTHASYLRWSVAHGYVRLHVDLCAATVMALSYGQVEQSDIQIRLEAQRTFANSRYGNHHSHQATAPKFVPVEYRGVPYLITEGEVGDFCDSLAGLGKFNDESYWVDWSLFLRKDGVKETGTADDLPILPAAYQYLAKRAIEGTVTNVGRRTVRLGSQWTKEYPFYESVTRVQINAGRSSGVTVGMRFYLLDSLEMDQLLIKKVGWQSSWGEVIRDADDAPGLKLADRKDAGDEGAIAVPLVRGNRVTTSYEKHFEVVSARNPQ
jgi:hypothetical protein